MMCHAKCAVITVRANIMAFSRVTDALDFSNVRYVGRGIMCAKQNRRAIVLWTRHIETSVEHAD